MAVAIGRIRGLGLVALLVAVWSWPAHGNQEQPAIENSGTDSDNLVWIEGKAFGARCTACEVWARYQDGTRIAVPVEQWSNTRIRIRLPDLNRGLQVQLSVRVGAISSRDHPAQVPVRYLSTVLLNRNSALSVGNKGEESIDVTRPAPVCGRPVPLFDEARIEWQRQRFADARIVRVPGAGCTQCAPLLVRWYHEPTGHLAFSVNARWRSTEGVCENARR